MRLPSRQHRNLVGRADLAWVLGDARRELEVAATIGLQAPTITSAITPVRFPAVTETSHAAEVADVEPRDSSDYRPADVPFFRATQFRLLEPRDVERVVVTRNADDKPWRDEPEDTPPYLPLADDTQIATALRNIAPIRTTTEIDVAAVVGRLANGELLPALPRRRRKSWGTKIQVILDRAHRLIPYWQDQDHVVNLLRHLYPRDGVEVAHLLDGANVPVYRDVRRSYVFPDPDVLILVLGDLGVLDVEPESAEHWVTLGCRLRENGNSRMALVPCRADDVSARLRQLWHVTPWEASNRGCGHAITDFGKRQLLQMVSPAVRIERTLLRMIRRMFPEGRCNAGLESLVWQELADRSFVAGTMDARQMKVHREQFRRQATEQRLAVACAIRQFRGKLSTAIWADEFLNFDDQLLNEMRKRYPTDFEDLRNYLINLSLRLEAETDADAKVALKAWCHRWRQRVKDDLYRCADPDLALAVEKIDRHVTDSRRHRFVGRVTICQIQQLGERFLFSPQHEAIVGSASPIAVLKSEDGIFDVDPTEITTESPEPWHLTRSEFPVDSGVPPWATEVGRDEYGYFACFTIDKVTQRLRWIPPGEFLMGSPQKELGRFSVEGPQHQVTITQGFWIFDTPCTQSLWQAVMGENPSRFKGETHPVERVSWEDCQRFIEASKKVIPGLSLSLPTEAQWEYACRAGTTAATYIGELDTERRRSSVLDRIAWHAGSENGSSPVAQKEPNPWGLYDMLGNVYEWCQDARRDYVEQRLVDPVQEGDASSYRVIRGGSWFSVARLCRAAYRYWYLPSDRFSYVGFRCRVQGSEPSQWADALAGAASGERRSGEGRSPRGDRDPTSGAGELRVNLIRHDRQSVPTPRGSCGIRSNREAITIHPFTKPAWASEVGRDRYGLWADLPVFGVTQRLRWIPPGRATLGSPPGEAGRADWEHEPHEFILEQGFWMFDTPCTQALWKAVVGDEPSRFKSPSRPVESVSWEQCWEFGERLSESLGVLSFSLPSESEWEYACRAGTTVATWRGELDILGDANAPLLDAIAWYGGNSGVGYDLEDGEQLGWLSNKQYEFEKAGTRPVGMKLRNPWGLYDMLGNVFEWCSDTVDGDGNRTDEASFLRVFRGGSWNSDARYCRAACRGWDHPSDRVDDVGFRCRVQEKRSEPSRRPPKWAEPSGDSSGVEKRGLARNQRS